VGTGVISFFKVGALLVHFFFFLGLVLHFSQIFDCFPVGWYSFPHSQHGLLNGFFLDVIIFFGLYELF